MFRRCLVLVLLGFSLISCGDQPPPNADPDKTPRPGENLPPPDSKTMQEALQGTWCYYSAVNGYPLYLGIKVEDENFQVASIYQQKEFGKVIATMNYISLSTSIDDTTQTVDVVVFGEDGIDLSDLTNPALLSFNGITKQYLKIKYAPGKIGFFKKGEDKTGCFELVVSDDELTRLPQMTEACPIDTLSCIPISDIDGDGVEDFQDNCSAVANPDQKNSDGNSTGDACQSCPEGEVLDNGICQKPEDQDNDGTPDTEDKCPFETNINFPMIGQSDLDGDGIGDKCDDDVDGDGKLNEQDDLNCIVKEGKADCTFSSLSDGDKDGIDDLHDNCLGTFNPNQEDSNNNGIGDACAVDKNNNGIEDIIEGGKL